jgi:hypothetical protein
MSFSHVREQEKARMRTRLSARKRIEKMTTPDAWEGLEVGQETVEGRFKIEYTQTRFMRGEIEITPKMCADFEDEFGITILEMESNPERYNEKNQAYYSFLMDYKDENGLEFFDQVPSPDIEMEEGELNEWELEIDE